MDDGPKGEAARAESGGCIVERLVEILGSRLVAVIAGVSQTSTLRAWIKGEPPADRLTLLQLALKFASEIAARHDERTAQSWFQGANHALDDLAPAIVPKRASLGRAGDAFADEQKVTQAFREFLDC